MARSSFSNAPWARPRAAGIFRAAPSKPGRRSKPRRAASCSRSRAGSGRPAHAHRRHAHRGIRHRDVAGRVRLRLPRRRRRAQRRALRRAMAGRTAVPRSLFQRRRDGAGRSAERPSRRADARRARQHRPLTCRGAITEFLDKQLREMRLSADVFVLRDGKMLLLKRSGGLGDGVWYLPGGIVEPERIRETPPRARHSRSQACISVSRSCCGSGTIPPRTASMRHTPHLRRSVPEGDIGAQPRAQRLPLDGAMEYAQRYCGEQAVAAAPQWAVWLHQVRRNCAIATEWLRRQAWTHHNGRGSRHGSLCIMRLLMADSRELTDPPTSP